MDRLQKNPWMGLKVHLELIVQTCSRLWCGTQQKRISLADPASPLVLRVHRHVHEHTALAPSLFTPVIFAVIYPFASSSWCCYIQNCSTTIINDWNSWHRRGVERADYKDRGSCTVPALSIHQELPKWKCACLICFQKMTDHHDKFSLTRLFSLMTVFSNRKQSSHHVT